MRNIIKLAFATFFTLSIIGCSENEGSGHDELSCSGLIHNSVEVEDLKGDTEYPFIDIDSVKISQNYEFIYIDIAVTELPSIFYYDFGFENEDGTVGNALEYLWEVQFDVGCDGLRTNDILVSSMKFNSASRELREGVLPDFTQNNVWQATGNSSENVGDVTVTAADGVISFTVPRNLTRELDGIDSLTPFKVTTFHNETGVASYDQFPDDGSYYFPSSRREPL